MKWHILIEWELGCEQPINTYVATNFTAGSMSIVIDCINGERVIIANRNINQLTILTIA